MSSYAGWASLPLSTLFVVLLSALSLVDFEALPTCLYPTSLFLPILLFHSFPHRLWGWERPLDLVAGGDQLRNLIMDFIDE